MTKLKLVCEAVKNNQEKTGYYIHLSEDKETVLADIRRLFETEDIPDVIPDYVSIEQKELYYYLHDEYASLEKKKERYYTILEGLNISSEYIMRNIIEPLFYIDDIDLVLSNMVISTRVDSNLVAISFGDNFDLLIDYTLVEAWDLIGAKKTYHQDLLQRIFVDREFLPHKMYGFSLFIHEGQLLNRINYYFRDEELSEDEKQAFTDMNGVSLIDSANQFQVYRKPYLWQVCLYGDNEFSFKYFYR